jgi:hypothetical protein
MSWKVIKRGLFVTLEGHEKEKCTDFLFQECKKFDVSECDDYWSTCWDKFRVKVFNKVKYEGHWYYDAEYVYDISQMKYLLIIFTVLASIAINLILNP